MAEVTLEKQFIGQARLVRLLLWKIGDSTDVSHCLSAALQKNMLTDEDVSFLQTCMECEEEHRESGTLACELTQDMLMRLRRCADKLNRADSA